MTLKLEENSGKLVESSDDTYMVHGHMPHNADDEMKKHKSIKSGSNKINEAKKSFQTMNDLLSRFPIESNIPIFPPTHNDLWESEEAHQIDHCKNH